jgi:type IV pilus biogenesis protein CpaD/CtpE
MNFLVPVVLVAITFNLIACAPPESKTGNIKSDTRASPFSFDELESSDKVSLPSLQYMTASDKIKLVTWSTQFTHPS